MNTRYKLIIILIVSIIIVTEGIHQIYHGKKSNEDEHYHHKKHKDKHTLPLPLPLPLKYHVMANMGYPKKHNHYIIAYEITKRKGYLKDLMDLHLASKFDPLMKISPWAYDHFAEKELKLDLMREFGMNGINVIKVGNDLISSHLGQKLNLLYDKFGLMHKTGSILFNNIDDIISRKDDFTTAILDKTITMSEHDPIITMLKNLMFKGVIFHMYLDASLHAHLLMFEKIYSRIKLISHFFEPYNLGIEDKITSIIHSIMDGLETAIYITNKNPLHFFNKDIKSLNKTDISHSKNYFNQGLSLIGGINHLGMHNLIAQHEIFGNLKKLLNVIKKPAIINKTEFIHNNIFNAKSHLHSTIEIIGSLTNKLLLNKGKNILMLLFKVKGSDMFNENEFIKNSIYDMTKPLATNIKILNKIGASVLDSIEDILKSKNPRTQDLEKGSEIIGYFLNKIDFSIIDAIHTMNKIAIGLNIKDRIMIDLKEHAFSELHELLLHAIQFDYGPKK